MAECLIVQPIHAAGIAVLERAGIRAVQASSAEPAAVLREVAGATAVITRNAGLSAAAIAAAPHLRVIAVHGVGTDPVAVEAATARGIAVVNTPGSNARSVAEHAIALTFALARSIVPADAAARAGDTGFKHRAGLTDLEGATFGVAGFGAAGRVTAGLARSLGMRVLVWSRSTSVAACAEAGAERAESLEALLAAADVVSLHLPLTSATRGLIGPRELALMKPSALLINTGRGALVDEAALAEALRERRIGGAGLDVFVQEPLPAHSPLAGLDTVVLSPHLAGSSRQALERTARLAAEQVVTVLAGGTPPHLVNPAVRAVQPGDTP
ncbi:hydroxyacid dehydrogenase [Labrys wisconsinensis]|uniref:D-3-phosphoglycerate dehydrogenase n=1 Tax=Labrys wisconsinensis TaxID=425677 RepID=A0ABU0JJY0_9HYPH|nr:hydroxyacid dehydrogenase [Labrys wisconsinensis]MDQ0474590.1 D-3-phosphoglycerate dehydrogenase [Labrys wisconsinensis]